MDRRERRARRLERRLEAAQVGVEETEELGVVQAAEKPDAAEETVHAAERVKTLEERRAARRERAAKLADLKQFVGAHPDLLQSQSGGSKEQEQEVETTVVGELAAVLADAHVPEGEAVFFAEQPELPGLVEVASTSTFVTQADSAGVALTELSVPELPKALEELLDKLVRLWVAYKGESIAEKIGAAVSVPKTSNKRTPLRGYKEQDFYTPEYAEFKARWAKMTLDEKVAEAQAAGATWTECDDPKIRNMRVMMAVLGHEGIVKWKPGFETDAKRRASVSGG